MASRLPRHRTWSHFWAAGLRPKAWSAAKTTPTRTTKILEVLDDFTAEHPGVEIEWIRLPAGINSREWMVAQQTAGTVPHIMPAAQWIIKEDVDKDWWVVLTDSLEEPNPYIAAGEPGQRTLDRPVLSHAQHHVEHRRQLLQRRLRHQHHLVLLQRRPL